MTSANFSIDLTSSLLSKAQTFLTKLDVKESKKQMILGSLGASIGGLCLYLLYKNKAPSQSVHVSRPEFKEFLRGEAKEEKEKTSPHITKSSIINPKTGKSIDVKTNNLIKNSMKTSRNYEDDNIQKLPSKTNFSNKLKEKNIFRDYNSFEEDLECDSLSTKEERLIHHRRRTCFSTDNELDPRRIKAKKNQLETMSKEGDLSDQLFFKLYANLSKDQ